MRSLVSYILLFAVMLPTLSPWGTIAYYHANKDYIARVLCENRSRPQLHCDGKCYLAKRLKAQQDKQDKETTEQVQKTPTLHLFCDDLLPFVFGSVALAIEPNRFDTYRLAIYGVTRPALFRPPVGRA